MKEILIRFLVGGAVVSLLAALGDQLRPKSFAGFFGAAPAVALATLSLTIADKTTSYATTESHSMIAGALAFFIYASCVSWVLMHHRLNVLLAAAAALPVWFAVAFGLWQIWLR
ncbi:MAG: hypothetical protein QOD84_2786 [Acidobacteriaceae bacterium]